MKGDSLRLWGSEMKNRNNKNIELFFRDADANWWNPNCGHDNRFWLFKAQSEYIREQLNLHVPICRNIRALDAGCGRGIHSRLLRNLGYLVTSLDLNPSMLALTSTIVDSYLVIGSLIDMPFDSHSFDVIVSIGTSMHVPTVETLLSEIHRVLTPEGIGVISMANKLSLYVLWTTRINPVLAKHQHLYHRDQFMTWNFKELLIQHGFEIVSSEGFAVVPPLSLKSGWRANIINPLMSKLLSWPFDKISGRYFGCGVTFIIRKI